MTDIVPVFAGHARTAVPYFVENVSFLSSMTPIHARPRR